MVAVMRLVVLAMVAAACDARSEAGPDAPPSGCYRAGAVTGVVDATITVAGVERGYVSVVPASYDPQRAYR